MRGPWSMSGRCPCEIVDEVAERRGLAGRIVAHRHTVAEGAHTAPVLVELSARHGVAMPIVTAVYGLLKGDTPREVVSDLLSRPLRAEQGKAE